MSHCVYSTVCTRLTQRSSPPLLDLDRTPQHRKNASETRSKGPVVQIAQVALECRVDQPLVFFLGQGVRAQRQADGCAGGLRGVGPGGGAGVDVGGEGAGGVDGRGG